MATDPRVARLYLPNHKHVQLSRGKGGIARLIRDVLTGQGFDVSLHRNTDADLDAAQHLPGYNVVRMVAPPKPGDVTYRRTYFPRFWRIETRAERWLWPVAKAKFDPTTINPAKAARLAANLRARHAPASPTDDNFVLVPLQGLLSEHRSFQTMSPLAMLDSLLQHDNRPIHATLHPRETYSDEDRAALAALAEQHPRLTVTTGGTDALLPRCSYVATQNSSVAMTGFLQHKPAVLFARSDFHHIAANVHDLGPAEAIRRAPDLRPDFDAYLWWFLRDNAIDDTRPDAPARVARALSAAGWPIFSD